MNDAFIYDHVRTPRGRGRSDGALHQIAPIKLASQTLRHLRERNNIDPQQVDDVGLGIVMPIGEQGADLTRFALLDAGYGNTVTGYQLNRFCTSSLDTVNQAAASIMAGMSSVVIAGGVESMSRIAIGSDGGACYTDPQIMRHYPYMPNGVAADLLATLNGFSREDVDEYAVQSQRRAAYAQSQGYFKRSIVPVVDVNGQILLQEDESIRPDTSLESLAKLKPAFEGLGTLGYNAIALQRYPYIEQIQHVHTGGNSSGIVDGASAILIGSTQFGRDTGLKARAKIRHFVQLASEPLISLGGPIPATEQLLRRTGMKISDIDLFEINEAFSVVPLSYIRHFDLDPQRVNVNGGAIALGHPLGATGAILVGTVLDELERRDISTAIVTLCSAGGQATATLIERI
ncbi:acetyl-CoA C-acetyltransferase [Acinetobacter baumannii]|uniref:acetyl-CoA C-acetyltransferase n=1 Tax=Acinetobacter baumannii TaxID=470 RepID=UPI0029565901|nr:acetyl-CoA C-acetyltransferase [Acinetobacter baumannii]MDV7609573.1 acetyl-CoA C-acetyltransferase [Acinetobacter baumannii]MDV7611364.1 acetyl-CoA C-acetyltransferase [Acinetobacter baumannii]MDV7615571.1 acetyl-CoA C-acetyltransferase [Acinetobacter baumannii]